MALKLKSMLLKAETQLLSIFILVDRSHGFSNNHRFFSGPWRRNNYKHNFNNDGQVRKFGSSIQFPHSDSEYNNCGSKITKNRIDDIENQELQQGLGEEKGNNQKQEMLNSVKNVKKHHIPVMAEEVLSYLEPKNNEIILDMTFGAGGHASEILKHSPNVRYIAADRDPLAFGFAEKFAAEYKSGQVIPLLSKFSELSKHLKQLNINPGSLDCVLMDLGVSSMQFDSSNRGFGLSRNGPLDMRMDGQRFPDSPTAADVVNSLEAHDLAKILKTYGEERMSKPIAHAIVEARYAFGKFTHTKQLTDIVKAVFDSKFRHDKLHRHSHVATKTFQALRIFVNDELNEIHNGLNIAHQYLKPGGRCAAISFHSLEDRIVKRHFHGIDMDLSTNMSLHGHLRNSRVSYDNQQIKDRFLSSSQWVPAKRKILEASTEEVNINPRARSAKLRAATKVG